MATVISRFFAIAFFFGGLIHLYVGRVNPGSYGAFASTALPPLPELWSRVVMPNISWLTVVMAIIEILFAIGLWNSGSIRRIAALACCGFFGILVLLGYAWPATELVDDFVKNRLFSLLMLGAMLLVAVDKRAGRLSAISLR